MPTDDQLAALARYPLLDALRERRSRRFGRGMAIGGPLAHKSDGPGVPLTEDEQALLAFAACGLTGPALGDLEYQPGGGGTIMAGMAGRTIASGDAIQTVAVFVLDQDAAWLLRRPRDFAPAEVPELVEQARRGEFTALYRRSRVKVRDGAPRPPLDPLYNLAVNRWSLYDPAGTYFLPVNDLTLLYINGLLEILDHPTCAFIVDERAGFRPAGLARFAASKGGHLFDDPRHERVLTVQQLETLVTEFVTLEQGMVLQNLALMAQALGLGGFPHWAAHPSGWLQALGFRMGRMPASRYLGMGWLLALLARLLRRDPPVAIGLGLERDGEPLLVPYCPPRFATMADAVRAVVDLKFGPAGVFRGGVGHGAWRDPERVAAAARPPGPHAIDATIAYCEYVHRRYGRFPAYQPPFRTVCGFQASHVDPEFYDRHYRPGALSATQREHLARWHPEAARERSA